MTTVIQEYGVVFAPAKLFAKTVKALESLGRRYDAVIRKGIPMPFPEPSDCIERFAILLNGIHGNYPRHCS